MGGRCESITLHQALLPAHADESSLRLFFCTVSLLVLFFLHRRSWTNLLFSGHMIAVAPFFRETWIGKNVQVHAAAFGQSGPEYATLPLHVRGNTFPNPKGYVTMPKAMTTKTLPPIGKVAAGW